MDVVVLNGARANDTKVDQNSDVLQSALESSAQVSVFKLRDIEVADCLGCFGCWIKTPGECIIDDAERDIVKKLVSADLIVFVSPVVFGGYSYELKKVLDRQICRILPFFEKVNGEYHHPQRYSKPAKLIAVGVLPKPDADSEKIFKTLVSRNAINMQPPAYAVGIVYFEDNTAEVSRKIRGLIQEVGVK